MSTAATSDLVAAPAPHAPALPPGSSAATQPGRLTRQPLLRRHCCADSHTPLFAAPAAAACTAAVSAAHAATMEWAEAEARALQRPQTTQSHASASALPSPPAAAAAPVAGLRVSQLDALSLDAELGWMLSASLRRAFKYLGSGGGSGGGGGGWVADHKAECEFALHAIMFACTVGRDRPTPGMKLQNLQFQNYVAVRPGRIGESLPMGQWALHWLGRIGLGRLASSAVDGVARSTRLDKLKLLLPQGGSSGAAATAASSAGAAVAASIPLSHFAPLRADGGAAGLLRDAASASASASVSALGATPVPPAILLSSLPSTAPVSLSLLQKSLYFGGSVLLRYAWTKLNHRMTMEGWGGFPEDDWHRRVYKMCRRIEHVYQALNIVNFVAFLHNGSYRTLLERLLSIRLVYLRSRLSRQVSFEFMNQQIAWAALSDFMLFLLPLINFGRIRDAAMWTAKIIGLVQGAAPSAEGAGEQGGPASLAAAVAAGCPCCGASPAVQPHVAIPCHHVFCYYCLSGNRLAERVQVRGDARAAALADYSCPACQQVITSQAPLQLQLQQSSAFFAAVPVPF